MMLPLILAQTLDEIRQKRAEAVRAAIRRESIEPYLSLAWMVLIALAVVAAALAAVWLWQRYGGLLRGAGRGANGARPIATFRRIAGELGLGPSDQWLLYRIAKAHALPTPLTLMLCPHTLDHHARQYVQPRSPRRQARILQRVERIRLALFEEA